MFRYAVLTAWALTAAPMIAGAQEKRSRRGDDDKGAWGGWGADRRGDMYGSSRVGVGTGRRLYRDVNATTYGEGVTRFRDAGDGRFDVARAQVSTRGDARVDIDRPTKGTIRGIVREARGDAVVIRVTNVYGYNADGELTITLRGDNEIGRMYGSGNSDHGRWSLRFDGNDRYGYGNDSGWGYGGRGSRNGDWGWDRSRRDGPGRGDDDVIDDTMRGYGTLSQDRGGTLSFDRARVELDRDGSAQITLDGRETVRLYGRWSRTRNGDMTVQLRRVNNVEANGEVRVDRQGRQVSYIDGGGRTTRGRFSVTFNARN